ncbi:MAG: CoA-binding protein [Brevinematales bacterium]|nr:CoA-binding protein [Brevinematales bacterium]
MADACDMDKSKGKEFSIKFNNPEEDEKIKDFLLKTKVIAVVGLSPKEDRPSNAVARYLKEKGYKIVPVNPGYDEILGEKCYKSLSDIPFQVDIVDIFRNPAEVVPVVQEAVRLKPKCIWLQLGIVNNDAKKIAEESSIFFVQDKCIKIEHQKLIG